MLIFGAGNKVTNCSSLLGTVQPLGTPLCPDEPGWLVPLADESASPRADPVLQKSPRIAYTFMSPGHVPWWCDHPSLHWQDSEVQEG